MERSPKVGLICCVYICKVSTSFTMANVDQTRPKANSHRRSSSRYWMTPSEQWSWIYCSDEWCVSKNDWGHLPDVVRSISYARLTIDSQFRKAMFYFIVFFIFFTSRWDLSVRLSHRIYYESTDRYKCPILISFFSLLTVESVTLELCKKC